MRKLLVVLARSFLDPAAAGELEAGLREVRDWQGLLRSASLEGLSGLLGERAALVGDPEGRALLTVELHACFTRNSQRVAEIYRVGEAFRRHEIEGLLLKGGGLLFSTYDRRVTARPLGDVDVLVHPGDRARAQRAAEELGYEFAGTSLGIREGLMLDLHVDLLNLSRVPARARAYDLPPDFLWAGSAALEEVPGLRVAAPEPEFVYLTLHAIKHSYAKLMWLLDLALVWRRVDPARLLAITRATRTERAVRCSVTLLERMFGIDAGLENLPPLNWLERRFVAGVAGHAPVPAGELVMALWIPGWLDRLRYLVQLFFPPSEVRAPGDVPRRLVELYRTWRRQREWGRA